MLSISYKKSIGMVAALRKAPPHLMIFLSRSAVAWPPHAHNALRAEGNQPSRNPHAAFAFPSLLTSNAYPTHIATTIPLNNAGCAPPTVISGSFQSVL